MSFKFTPKKVPTVGDLIKEQKEIEEQKKRAEAALQTTNKDLDKNGNLKSPAQLEREASGYVEPEFAKERIAIIFDDSGSMDGPKIRDAHAGCIEFLRNCQLNSVACAVHPMNLGRIELDTNLPKIAALIPYILATGGTPMFKTWSEAQDVKEPAYTRMIIFSDGRPTDNNEDYYGKSRESKLEKHISRSIESNVCVDTVFIADNASQDAPILKEIAERTGGFYLRFDRNKVNFRDAFKYLSPGLRLQLADKSFRDSLEEGKIK